MPSEFRPNRKFPNFKFLYSLIDWKSFRLYGNKNLVNHAQTIEDLKTIAKRNIPKVVFDYVEGSASEEISYQRSVDTFRRTEFNVKNLINVEGLDTTQNILSKKVDLPVIFAPTGYTQMMHHAGEPAVANVAAQRNLIYVLSTMGTTSPEELAEQIPGVRRWMQLYVMRNRKDTEKLVKSAKENGFEALMVTIDTPVTGIKIRDLKNGLTVPPRIRLGTLLAIATKPRWWFNLITTKKLEFAAFKGWNKPLAELAQQIFSPEVTDTDIRWLKSIWKGPIIIKGIQSVEDAKRVVSLGVSAIVVSNQDRKSTRLNSSH